MQPIVPHVLVRKVESRTARTQPGYGSSVSIENTRQHHGKVRQPCKSKTFPAHEPGIIPTNLHFKAVLLYQSSSKVGRLLHNWKWKAVFTWYERRRSKGVQWRCPISPSLASFWSPTCRSIPQCGRLVNCVADVHSRHMFCPFQRKRMYVLLVSCIAVIMKLVQNGRKRAPHECKLPKGQLHKKEGRGEDVQH